MNPEISGFEDFRISGFGFEVLFSNPEILRS
jgi:hypothetical protein